MKLYAMTIKFPHASVVRKLLVTKSSMEKSCFNSLILFSESALPRYKSYKSVIHNAYMLERFICVSGIEPDTHLIDRLFKELILFTARAA